MTSDLSLAAQVSQELIKNPNAMRQLLAYEPTRMKLIEDPVFFAILMCGDRWLANAPEHQKLLRDMSQRQVAVCGRGWGKSLVFSRKNLWLLFTKKNVESLIISSTQRQSMIMFDYCYSTIMANSLMREMVQNPGTTRTVIKLKTDLGGKIIALPCSKDRLRGYHPDYIFIDEASIVPTEMITGEIMMMLTKPNSSLIMCGTPMSTEHIFHKAYQDTSHYSVHHYAGYQSPLVSKQQVEEWKEAMTTEQWQREVEATWTEATYSFFPMDLIVTCLDPDLDNPNSPNAYIEDMETFNHNQRTGSYHAGLDLGKQVDHSVLAITQKLDNNEIKLIHKHQFPLQTNYPDIIGYVARAQQIFNFDKINVDKTGIGDPVIDELQNRQVHGVEGVLFTDTIKEELLNNLKLQMQKKQLKIPANDRTLIAQINEQQYEYLQPKTAQEKIHLKFWHPRGSHDDQLMALALACKAATQSAPPGISAFLLPHNPQPESGPERWLKNPLFYPNRQTNT
jgi:predicted nucleic acid-binding protein